MNEINYDRKIEVFKRGDFYLWSLKDRDGCRFIVSQEFCSPSVALANAFDVLEGSAHTYYWTVQGGPTTMVIFVGTAYEMQEHYRKIRRT